MLRLMRENASSWIIKILLALIVVVFMFFGIDPGNSKQQNIAATVNKTDISMDEYRFVRENIINNYRRQFGNNLNDDLIKMLGINEKALEALIDKTLIMQEAKRLSITISPEELVNDIKKIKAFQIDGEFDSATYKNRLKYASQSPDYFELKMKEELIDSKIRALITDTVQTTDKEAREWFVWEKTQNSIDYVLFQPSSHKDVKPSKEEVEAYYEKNKEKYKSNPQVKVSYLSFIPGDYSKKVTISADAISAYYGSNLSKYETEKTVEARHILIKTDESADEIAIEKARTRVLDIHKMATEGKKDFAQLAMEFSEGPSKSNGGSLGTFPRGQMVKPFADKAFSMKAGEISAPVKTQFGWHLIKVEKINAATKKALEDVKDEITKALSKQESETLAYDDSEDVFNAIMSGEELNEAAEARNIKLVTTDMFTREAGPLEIPATIRWNFTKSVYDMALNEISDVLEFDGNYYIVQVNEKKASEIQPLEKVKTKVESAAKITMRDEKAKNDATGLLAALKSGEKDITKEKNLKTTGLFSRDSKGGDLKIDTEVISAAFSLSEENKLSEAPVSATKGYYVICLKDRKKPEGALFEKEKDRIMKQLLEKKKTNTYNSWMAQVRSRSKIERNSKIVN